MLPYKMRILLITLVGTIVTGIFNFAVFLYFYKDMATEHLSEYWRTVHGGRMLTEVLPAHIILALLSVGIIIFTTHRFVCSADQKKR